MPRPKITPEDFAARVQEIYGDKIVVVSPYQHSHLKLKLRCQEHGEFESLPSNVTRGGNRGGCPQCSWSDRRLGHEKFVARARVIHGSEFTYLSEYQGIHKPITVVCSQGHKTSIDPANHLKHGCKKCGHERRALSQTLTQTEFESKMQDKFGDKFSLIAPYSFMRESIEILCPLHGQSSIVAFEFLDSPYGCAKCGVAARPACQPCSKEEFVTKAKTAHDGYFYPGEYKKAHTKMQMVCPRGHEFEQTPNNHLQGKGCSLCSHNYSEPHREIEAYLAYLGVPFESNTRSGIPPKELDIWVPEHNLAIEFNGTYWHSLDGSEPSSAKMKHHAKFLSCESKDIRLLQIDEYDWVNPTRQSIWKSVIASRLGKHTKRIHARQTEFREIDREAANLFLDANHLQGSTPSTRFCYGIFLEAELVGVITFAYHEKTMLNLTRLAFPVGTTVVGGANKLFKNALKALPKRDIITFSNNQYSAGSVYQTLGFTKDADLPPSYQWFYKGGIINKRQCRHSRLPALLGGMYDPNLTEHQNMYRAGARCLYDAGYQRWKVQVTS